MFSDKEKAFTHWWTSCNCQSSVTPRGWFSDGWDAALKEQGEVKVSPRSCSVCFQNCTGTRFSAYFCVDCWAKRGEAGGDETYTTLNELNETQAKTITALEAQVEDLDSALQKMEQGRNAWFDHATEFETENYNLKEKLEGLMLKQGEEKAKIARLQQNVDQWVKTGTAYFDEIVALKRERTELKNERDTWKGRHQTLKSAIGKATQVSNLDATTYG